MTKFLGLLSAKRKFYITAAIPYVNARPHVGHALEYVQTDVIKRYHQLIGDETLLLCGGDENAIKNVQAAEKEGIPTQEFVDKNSKLFYDLAEKLDIHFDVFQKGSNTSHHKSSQELWKRCQDAGDIYKKEYTGLYCVGCELFYEPEELNENGECFEHPGKKLEKVTEDNYFFKLSKYENQIRQIIESDEIKIIPAARKNEVLAFLKQGLKDISISRSAKRARNWGVDVPEDPTQKMYVWFDALNIYQSGIGFASDDEQYNKWWPADVHVIGKGIIRFHAIYWPAFLLSAKLKLPKSLFVHGYFTVDGQKMSKSLGNVIDPIELIEKYGTDALRYYFLHEISPTDDGDFSEKRLKETYNTNLANGIGNLVARVAAMVEKGKIEVPKQTFDIETNIKLALELYQFDKALDLIWNQIRSADKLINERQAWKLEGEEKEKILVNLVNNIRQIATNLKPFLPETAKKIDEQFKESIIKTQSPLFPRLS